MASLGHNELSSDPTQLLANASMVLAVLTYHFDGLVQERSNSIALAMELRLSCTNPSNFLGDGRCISVFKTNGRPVAPGNQKMCWTS